jgi:hypothetical protein
VVAVVVVAAAAAVAVVAIATVAPNRVILRVIAPSKIHAADKAVVQVNKAAMGIWIRLGMTFLFCVCVRVTKNGRTIDFNRQTSP